ncbi:MEGF10_11 [Mytilus coruscus]|uniref:MEGF10_11 n=1 Tax=Mytilus coruscus TaxID=42192 RepID=A0A6J8AX01_MYTCO|nr:MEGF10_11 [Mytilus coruscus]
MSFVDLAIQDNIVLEVNCLCDCDGACDPVTGECHCRPGYTGSHCSKGECHCQPGYIGSHCSKVCPAGTFGNLCQQKCTWCDEGQFCDHITGQCLAITCPPGYTGHTCQKVCPKGTAGIDCLDKCPKCDNGGLCDYKLGRCICLPGFRGDFCQAECPKSKYGIGCNTTCNCENQAYCRPSDGFCKCLPGYMGVTCSQTCTTGYYGENCAKQCQCTEKQECNPVYGCIGRDAVGHIISLSETAPQESDPAVAIVTVMIVLFLLVVLFVGVYMYRRMSRLKKENEILNSVHFSNSQSEISGINNPNFTTSSSTDGCHNNCTDRPPSCTSVAEGVDDRYTTIKNINADFGNPNLSNVAVVADDNGYEEFVPSKKDFLFKEKLNVNLNNLSPDKSDTGHDYDNVSVDSIDSIEEEKKRNNIK